MLPTTSLAQVTSNLWQLDVAVGSMRLSAHPLFTAEDAAAQRLIASCILFDEIQQARAAAMLEGRLQALRDGLRTASDQLDAMARVSVGDGLVPLMRFWEYMTSSFLLHF
jgi:hypothetical protein